MASYTYIGTFLKSWDVELELPLFEGSGTKLKLDERVIMVGAYKFLLSAFDPDQVKRGEVSVTAIPRKAQENPGETGDKHRIRIFDPQSRATRLGRCESQLGEDCATTFVSSLVSFA